jgi:hypothetical protein
MALFVPTASEGTMLQLILHDTGATPTDPVIKLYTNNHTPAAADTAATYTEVVAGTFTWYAAKTLAGTSWTTSTASRPATSSFAQQTWTCNAVGGSSTIYGYFIVQTTSGLLLFAELFTDGPYTMVNSGDAIKITPSLSLT